MDRADFTADPGGLAAALDALVGSPDAPADLTAIPAALPDTGIGAQETLAVLAGPVLGGARDLGAAGFFAHMDPPTPWITWAMHAWIASRNQNLLHPETAPVARDIERRVVEWLAPLFAMSGGHMTPGSTVANLTALWAARQAGATEVASGPGAHVSVAKAAHILALPHRTVADWTDPGDLGSSCVVLTAGTTSTGEIEPLDAAPHARWRHVDAAWSGPLRLSERHAHLLDGIERADSVAISAHKWLFQPKESALVLFADHEAAHASISFGGAYLAAPNVGLLGSHGAVAVPLLATLLAYGRSGLAATIDATMALAAELHDLVVADPDLIERSRPHSGVLCWRHAEATPDEIRQRLAPEVTVSSTVVDGIAWLRSVAANPMAEPATVIAAVAAAAAAVRRR